MYTHSPRLVANAIGARSDGRSPVEVRAVHALNLNVDPRTPGRPPSQDYVRHGDVSVHVSPCPSEQGRTAATRAGEVAFAADLEASQSVRDLAQQVGHSLDNVDSEPQGLRHWSRSRFSENDHGAQASSVHVMVQFRDPPPVLCPSRSERAGEVAYAALGAVCVCCVVSVGVAISAVVVGGVMLIYGD